MGQCFSRLHGKHNISTAARTGIIPTTQEDQPNPTPTESDSTRAQSEEQFDPDATGNGKLHANPQTVDINTIKDEIFTALGNGMVGKKGEEIILPEVVEKIWKQNHHRKFYINQSWYKSEWDRNNFMDEMIQIMSILIRISFDQWSKFGEKFVHHGDRRDCNLPFALETLQEKGFLGVSLGELFYEKQFAFCPVPIPEQEDQFILDREKRLPWIDEPKFVEKGGYGEVNKRTVAKGFLRFQNRTTNLEVSCHSQDEPSGALLTSVAQSCCSQDIIRKCCTRRRVQELEGATRMPKCPYTNHGQSCYDGRQFRPD